MRHAGVALLPFFRPLWLAVLTLAGLTAVCTAPSLGAQEQQQRGVALIERAMQLENLLSPETGPFRLRVRVKLFGLVDGTREGTYLLMAASPSQWFDQVRFPGYAEMTGVVDGQRWRKRNVIDKPYRFHEVARLLDVASHLRLPADAKVNKLSQSSGARSTFCIETGPTADLWQRDSVGRAAISEVARWKDSGATLCFDADTGALVSAAYTRGLPRFEYEGLVVFGTKAYPKTLRCYEGKELAVEANVEELVAQDVSQGAAGFAVPAGADRWPDCRNPEPPRLVEKKAAAEDPYAKARRQYGTVIALAEIGTDGLIHDLTFLQARGVLFDSVKKAVAHWRYQPATCGGTPVPMEIYLAYTFTP